MKIIDIKLMNYGSWCYLLFTDENNIIFEATEDSMTDTFIKLLNSNSFLTCFAMAFRGQHSLTIKRFIDQFDCIKSELQIRYEDALKNENKEKMTGGELFTTNAEGGELSIDET